MHLVPDFSSDHAYFDTIPSHLAAKEISQGMKHQRLEFISNFF